MWQFSFMGESCYMVKSFEKLENALVTPLVPCMLDTVFNLTWMDGYGANDSRHFHEPWHIVYSQPEPKPESLKV